VGEGAILVTIFFILQIYKNFSNLGRNKLKNKKLNSKHYLKTIVQKEYEIKRLEDPLNILIYDKLLKT
jgi:hypothetical protein